MLRECEKTTKRTITFPKARMRQAAASVGRSEQIEERSEHYQRGWGVVAKGKQDPRPLRALHSSR